MAAAVVRASVWTGSSPTAATAETGIVFNRAESATSTTETIPKPTSTGTNYSWPKVLALEVTTVGTTTINNRRVHRASAPSAGLTMWYRDDGGTYNRPTAVAAADNTSTDDATPSGYTAMPSSATQYDNTSVATSSTGKNGDYVSVALGVSNLYVGGAGSGIALPNIVLTFDEF